MSLLRRIGSIKRSSYSMPRRMEAHASGQRERGMIRCHITLLDDNVFTCDVHKHQLGEVLLDEVYAHLDIVEKDYFGLSYKEEGITKWLDPSKQLKKQFRGSHTLALEFRVKFYVLDPSRLQEELTRYQFYLQVKRDLAMNRMHCSFESAALLGSYIIQAEMGDFEPDKILPGYVSELRFIPNQTEEMEDRVAELHQGLRGKSTSEAEFLFLAYARRLEFYGVELYPARDHHGVELGLGITTSGVGVFRNWTIITTFAWLHIQKITYKRKRFYIELRPDQGALLQNVVGFHMESYDGCKQLWKNCIEYHAFFRMSEVRATSRRSFIRKSKYKYSGRTERQAMEENRERLRERSSMRVQRTPSKRFARRSMPTRGGGEPNVSSIKRSTSFKDEFIRPVVRPRINGRVRAVSEERDYDEEDSAFSPEITVSDDMTGQFSLVPADPPGHLSLNFRRFSDSVNEGPTEYYDERNAAEELAGQVCMDDLASEGLLLIRVQPDERGRYGFNVKKHGEVKNRFQLFVRFTQGGTDQMVPVIVTGVQSDSPAAHCNPPLEEGDQVLYINGKSVTDRTHDQVILMIRAGSGEELVLIIKPRDLSRINPTLGREALSRISDPGHVLRESLTHLKETLSSGMAQLHFDRLYRRKPGMAAIASKLPQNLSKNRYRDISAYDSTRVHLQEGPDYINANFVNMEIYTTGQINRYVAAQGPMQHTCKDFWQMVWEQNSTLVVMLTEVVEGGKVRCCGYWPDVKSSLEYGKYEVFNLSEQKDRISITRQLRLRNNMTGETRQIVHMQYIDWPDHGIPGSQVDFLRFVQSVRSFREGMAGPVIVHCSAGIGRTGVFVLMETALCKMEVLEPIYPLEIVRNMRDQRGMLVQTPIQYQFVCQSILKSYEEDYVEIEIPNRSLSSSRNTSITTYH